MPLLSLKEIQDSVDFATFAFAQRVKMKWWEDHLGVKEEYLDKILLLAWQEFKKK